MSPAIASHADGSAGRTIQIVDGLHLELLPFLRDAILERATKYPSRGSNNVGGWKSDADFFAWPGEEIRTLHRTLTDKLGGSPYGWAMINRAGSYHKRHVHGMPYRCGVYYVATGDPPVPTVFEIGAPNAPIEVAPEPGKLVLFPGSMWHSVPRYAGSSPRITIAIEARS